MKILRTVATGVLAMLFSVSCTTKDEIVVIPSDYPEPIGSYTFAGERFDLRTAAAGEDTTYFYEFMFSPLPSSESFTTYIYFAVASYFEGKSWNVEDMNHNYDYMLVYEDPVHYYSVYRELKGGTIFVEDLGSRRYNVKLNVRLADGTPLNIEYRGGFELLRD